MIEKHKIENIFKNKINVTILVSIFIFIFFLFIRYELLTTREYLLHRFHEKITSVESTLDTNITDAKHLMYGLGITIADNSIISDQNKLKELIHNFDPRLNYNEYNSVSLSGITFIDATGNGIIQTTASNSYKRITNSNLDDIKACKEENKTEPFITRISPIRMGTIAKELIIPISMTISDSNNNYIGTLCSGIIVRELNNKLSLHFDSRHLNVIKIINKENNYRRNNLNQLDLKNFLNANFFNKNMIYTYDLKNLPFSLMISIKHSFLKNSIYRFASFALVMIIFLIVIIYITIRNNKKYYQAPLYEIQTKLETLNMINNNDNIIDKNVATNFCPVKLSKSINELINKFHPILLEQTDEYIKKNALQKRILDLIFVEQHFMHFQKLEINEEKLFLNKLYKQINEESIYMPLYDFLRTLVDYCCEYYPEINIKLDIKKIDRKNFLLKQSALIETIFNIITFIIRASLNVEDDPLVIRAEFIENQEFPTINIEVNIENYHLNPPGKDAGPYYVHTSLLTVFLLAKENKLHFNIIRNKNIISFILQPLETEIKNFSTYF